MRCPPPPLEKENWDRLPSSKYGSHPGIWAQPKGKFSMTVGWMDNNLRPPSSLCTASPKHTLNNNTPPLYVCYVGGWDKNYFPLSKTNGIRDLREGGMIKNNRYSHLTPPWETPLGNNVGDLGQSRQWEGRAEPLPLPMEEDTSRSRNPVWGMGIMWATWHLTMKEKEMS